MTKEFFIFGAGYSGRAIAREVLGEAAFVGGTTRNPENAETLQRSGITPFVFDGGSGLSPEISDALSRTTHLIVSIAPDAQGDPLLAVGRDVVGSAMPALKWIGYLSTVGVYGDHGGAWVDETSACDPVSERSKQRLATENDWLRLGSDRGLPVAILRLSGIYGPGRNALANLAEGKARRIVKPGQVFNRIHVDDIAGATAHLARRREGGLFNVTDDAPSPPQDVVAYAARIMGIEPPPEVAFEAAGLSPMGRSFYGECKRAANAKLKATGYRMRHPDYRAALDAMWAEDRWRAENS
ncbi:SDR family oxidoreductase [Nitratireductor sp. ZSWI3]|uniref:SDR family oxidoreductase n=1 Tax=Nitratireductor sp. ZSWI3 TaxID=2966359 RepID=UPI00214F61F9|nr:SDR family oxidoreductase [Nitratireductor sp. ZSWI3]MCR4268891.1 SDR family oxidoreductase [Nitratireductor sp. ZSWI3]